MNLPWPPASESQRPSTSRAFMAKASRNPARAPSAISILTMHTRKTCQHARLLHRSLKLGYATYRIHLTCARPSRISASCQGLLRRFSPSEFVKPSCAPPSQSPKQPDSAGGAVACPTGCRMHHFPFRFRKLVPLCWPTPAFVSLIHAVDFGEGVSHSLVHRLDYRAWGLALPPYVTPI